MNNQVAGSFLPVMVLYKEAVTDSPTFNTLMGSIANLDHSKRPVRILVYDNTPQPEDPGALPENICYEAPGRNAGLAVAYNRALQIADEVGASWLLLLDQDTVLPLNFLDSLCSELEKWAQLPEVVAVVPIVRSSIGIISPKRVGFWGLKSMDRRLSGPSGAEVMAINSGTALRCDFVRSIGGFNRAYWLDYLDHWLFRQIYKERKRVAVYNCILDHHLSLHDLPHNIDPTRYRSILAAESAFMTSQKTKLQIPYYLCRLGARTVRYFIQGQRDLALFTIKTIAKIALHPWRSLEEHPS